MFDGLVELIRETGYLGIALLMLLEHLFPPLPSELIMPLAGFNAARGQGDLWLTILAGSVGSLAGTSAWYVAGRWIGKDRLKTLLRKTGRWLAVSPDDLKKAEKFFKRYENSSVFLGRLIPAVRTLISLPAGIFKMSLIPFLIYSSIGTVLWTALLTFAGYHLEEHYEKVSDITNIVTNIVVLGLITFYIYKVITYKQEAD